MASLTEKQKRFAAEYLIDLNATAAAKRAGYSEKTAYSMGQRLLKNVEVQTAIQKRQAKLQSKLEITQETVLQELAAIAFANGADFAQVTATGSVKVTPTKELPKEKLPAIAAIKENQYGVEIKMHDKVRALELLGKHLGVFESGSAASLVPENNLFAAIDAWEEDAFNDLSELQPEAGADDEVVEAGCASG